MKTYTLLKNCLIILVILAGMNTGKAQVMLYDNFDYPAGDSLIWHNWLTQQTNLTNAILVSNEGLSYPSYPCSGIGNGAAIGTTGQDVFRGFVKQTLPGSLIYMSFLVKVTSAATGDCFIALKESPTSPTNVNFRGRAYAKADGSNIAFGISKGAVTAPAVADYTPSIYSLNTTYLLVVKYKIVEGSNNDSAWLFVNPVIGQPEPAPSVTATDMTPSDIGLGSVLLRQGTAGSSPTVIVDGVRVSKTWQQALTASNISTLSDLKVDGTTIPGFNSSIYQYYDTVPSGQPNVTLAATATDWAATIDFNTAPGIPGVSTVVVTAENGTNTSTYTINHAYAYHYVDVVASPAGTGTVTGAGVYGEGFQATVTATAATDYIFLNWTENGNVVSTSPVYTFTVTGPTTMTANFVPAYYEVDALVDPTGTVLGTGTYAYGEDATLTAVPNTGYDFVNWTENGDTLGTDLELVLEDIDADHLVTAHFVLQTYTVTATANPAEGGTVSGAGTFTYGTNVTLTAQPNTGYIFDNWTEDGDTLGTDPVLVLQNLSSDRDITGNFIESLNTFTVTGTANPPEAGSVIGGGNVPLGGSITLTAITNEWCYFQNWTEDGVIVGTDTSITLTNVSQNHFLVANFLSTIGLPENSIRGLKIYPTLASENIFIQANDELVEVRLYNLMGQQVIGVSLNASEYLLNVSMLPAGSYLVQVRGREGMETKKVFVR